MSPTSKSNAPCERWLQRVKERAKKLEQARLKEVQAEQLRQEAENIKRKK